MARVKLGRKVLKNSVIILLLLAIIATLSALPCYAGGLGLVWTDKPDYEFWETVTISGSGFNPNANIDVTITRPDDVVDTGSAMSNASGNFVYYYVLNGIDGTYIVTATDGVNSASTTFTESRYHLEGYTNLPSAKWTRGSLKGWLECQEVPYRLKMTEVEATTYVLSNYHDNELEGVTGIDYCTGFYVGYENESEAPTAEATFSVSGPFYQTPVKIKEIYYTWTVTYTSEAAGKTYCLYWKAHLAIGSSNWPGAKLHGKTDVTGAQDVPIMVPPAVLGEISGYKFNDLDVDGVWDLSEPVLTDGWNISLYMWDNTTSQWVFQTWTTTDINGYYNFTSLFYGDYKVTEDVKDGWINTLSPGYPITLNDTAPTSENNNFGNYEWQDVDVSKTANVEWNRVFTWDIEKTVDQATLNLLEGEEGTVSYTITVTKSVASDSYRVYGTITILNPNPSAIEVKATVIDEVLNPSEVAIGSQDFGTQTLAPGTNTFNYSIELSPGDIGPGYYKNKVTVTATEPIDETYVAYSPTFEFTEPTEKIHDSAIISDIEDLGGLALVSTTYDGPWTTSTSNIWAFTKTVKSDSAGSYILTDTAEVQDKETGYLFDSDEESVHVFVSAPPPPPVGGKAIPINKAITKPESQTPWIWLTTLILSFVVAVGYVKKRKRNTEIIF